MVVDVAGRKRGMQLRNLSKNIQSIRSGKLIVDLNMKYDNIKISTNCQTV